MSTTTGRSLDESSRRSFLSRMHLAIFGKPLATSVQLEHRLPILFALPVFASDALSSVAYATEEILIQFEHANAGAIALQFLLPISIAIALLVWIVGTSYRQAIRLYPQGGGSYSVSRDNLGVFWGVVAASALTIDYILTVAVSVSSGVQYLGSMAPWARGAVTLPYTHTNVPMSVLLALLLVGLLTFANLRGTRESGIWFALPAYSFMGMLGVLFVASLMHFFAHPNYQGAQLTQMTETAHNGVMAVGLIWVLRAFSSGCSALTGVEAVSNGVSAFEPPEGKNASKTLLILISSLIVLFIGVGLATIHFHVLPEEGTTVISQIAAACFGTDFPRQPLAICFILVNVTTLLVLMVAANASFAGLPRLLALVAKDGYAPKAFISLGDRLVHNRGILMLAGISALLILGFKAETTLLIPLYAVGVFICFTLSQLGMARRIHEQRDKGWQQAVVINLVGAAITGVVAIVQAVAKFTEGAWMVVVLMPLIILLCYRIKRHYDWFDAEMTLGANDYNPLREASEPITVLVLISSDIHRGIVEGLECGRAITDAAGVGSVLRAVHVELDPEKTPRLKAKWEQHVAPYLGRQIKLDIQPSPYRWLIEPVMEYLDKVDLERVGDRIIVVVPEFETGSFFTQLLHNFTANRLRTALLNRPNVTVVFSRYFMKRVAWRSGRGGLVY